MHRSVGISPGDALAGSTLLSLKLASARLQADIQANLCIPRARICRYITRRCPRQKHFLAPKPSVCRDPGPIYRQICASHVHGFVGISPGDALARSTFWPQNPAFAGIPGRYTGKSVHPTCTDLSVYHQAMPSPEALSGPKTQRLQGSRADIQANLCIPRERICRYITRRCPRQKHFLAPKPSVCRDPGPIYRQICASHVNGFVGISPDPIRESVQPPERKPPGGSMRMSETFGALRGVGMKKVGSGIYSATVVLFDLTLQLFIR